MKTSEILREAMSELRSGQLNSGSHGWAQGLCLALHIADRDKAHWSVATLLFKGEDKKFFTNEYDGYWLLPLSDHNWKTHTLEASQAYTARIMVLEWCALEYEEVED